MHQGRAAQRRAKLTVDMQAGACIDMRLDTRTCRRHVDEGSMGRSRTATRASRYCAINTSQSSAVVCTSLTTPTPWPAEKIPL